MRTAVRLKQSVPKVVTRKCECGGIQLRIEKISARHQYRVEWGCASCGRVEIENAPLSFREIEVVQALCAGDGKAKDVASRLSMNLKTVETHRANIFRKLGVHSVVELVKWAIRNRIAEP